MERNPVFEMYKIEYNERLNTLLYNIGNKTSIDKKEAMDKHSEVSLRLLELHSICKANVDGYVGSVVEKKVSEELGIQDSINESKFVMDIDLEGNITHFRDGKKIELEKEMKVGFKVSK